MRDRLQSSTNYPMLFFMTSSTDHITGATGLSPTVIISKNAGSFGSPSGAVSEVGNGWYALAGNAADRNTLGPFAIHATGSGADPSDTQYNITGFDPYNSSTLGLSGFGSSALASNGLDSIAVEAGVNPRQALALIGAALGGVLSGAGTSAISMAALNNPGTDRIDATVDGNGNRTSITLHIPP